MDFDLNYNLHSENLLNPLNRTQTNLDFITSINAPMQSAHDSLFTDYKKGANYPAYNGGTSYSIYNKVIFTDKGVYESLSNGNVGNSPDSSPLMWRKRQDLYIGVDERIKWNGQNMVLAALLNKWYGITAPNYIWIQNYGFVSYGFDVWVPNALFTTLGATLQQRKDNVSQVVNKYIAAGVTHLVVGY